MAKMSETLLYDPPSGWKYGFPRPYKPRKGETLAQTLKRDGYPEHELKSIMQPDGSCKWVRFIGGQHG